MTKDEIRARIEEIGIIPAVRLSSAEDALFAAEAVCNGGIPIVEVTMTVPGAVKVILELTRQSKETIVGAGTIIDVDSAHRCLDAGATFLTTTGLDLEIVDFARKRDVVVFPGACTPTEVLTAWKAGADFVKIFPCSAMGGAGYIRALKGPFPQIPMIASGGVNQHTCGDFILAGATAVGIGQDLIHRDAIKRREREWIRELARRYRAIVQQARSQLLNP
ncbi:MAG TPA: bifunctional 4-hydroxy-2-oxoglutarate aldolase/2-dehydro-3-deoxy-phosphogluconate aldolase [Bryobacteraceae bacterium]|nr:bifunctional 4-hydroxy-2-oxoglutarate aldolase/2-dehydro-3-deoxy-phosphogluconate aldolase [Bryobacteraceae bacterium]